MIFKDNGIGIDLERNKDKVFGLYQRFHDYPEGKGLGLYLVKSQVETMGGTISIESAVNIGTTFTLTFKNK
jgi:signal transduction histidine kinase